MAHAARGRALLEDPWRNKGTAFTLEERRELGLDGLLPHRVEDLGVQVERVKEAFDREPSDLDRHIMLRALEGTNRTLFHAFVRAHLVESMPVVYTPTVGLACQQFSHIYRKPSGAFLAYPDRDRLGDLLANVEGEVDVIVVTDGQRILGLGDQGVGGMGIPIGKLALYTACAGIDPARTLPVLLDVGTDDPALLADPLYVGWRHERVTGTDYDDFVEAFISAVERHFPAAVLQWEDFAKHHASRLLDRYRRRLPSFNDDIQGTAAVAHAALLSAVEAGQQSIGDQRICVFGGGSAGTGIAGRLVARMVDDGMDLSTARRRIWMIDRDGLIHDGLAGLWSEQLPFARPAAEIDGWVPDGGPISLLTTIERVAPTVLIGVSGQAGAFDETAMRALAERVERPIVLPLSNPTELAEAHPADLIAWTDGAALVATGSPFDDVVHDGHTHVVAQSNNVYVFPGLGMGTIAVRAREVTDGMIRAAARAVARRAPCCADDIRGGLLPPLADLVAVSRDVAVAVATEAQREGVATVEGDPATLVAAATWEPAYPPF